MIKRRARILKRNRAQHHCKVYLFAVCLSLISPLAVYAQAPVIDDSDNYAMMDEQEAAWQSPPSEKYSYDAEDAPSWQAHNQDDQTPLAKDDGNREADNPNQSLADKVQNLQKEIQELRGQLEVQAHELKKLTEQQLAFYKDLDARIHPATNTAKAPLPAAPQPALTGKVVAPPIPEKIPAKVASAPQISSAPTGIPGKQGAYIKSTGSIAVVDKNEKGKYLAAWELVKNKRHDQAIAAMQEFLVLYPRGVYTANAHYWLGELYMIKNNYAKAIEQFVVVLDQFPQSDKSSASTLKWGYALAASGKITEAKYRLQQVIRLYPGTAVAQLAQEKLHSLQVS